MSDDLNTELNAAPRARLNAPRAEMEFEWCEDGEIEQAHVPLDNLPGALNRLVNRCMNAPRRGGRSEWITLTEGECAVWGVKT